MLDLLRAGAGAILCGIGALLMLGGVAGLLRFPDVFTRLHAAGVTMSLGAAVSILGLIVVSDSPALAARLLFLLLVVVTLAPALSHISGRGAHAAGLTPIAGAYTAPRPGQNPGQNPGQRAGRRDV